MLKTRILLFVVSALLIALIFMLPKVAVENESQLATATENETGSAPAGSHTTASEDLLKSIRALRASYFQNSSHQKNAIFADSLTHLYTQAGQFDSAAWFAEQAATFFNTQESFVKAGNSYYDAFTFAMDDQKRQALAERTQFFLGKVLEKNPKDLEAKSKLAMTYVASATPMQGISMLREVLAEDPKNETALLNMGMLSMQSGQYDRAIERLQELIQVNPNHSQAQLLLGVAYLNKGDREKAKAQFEKVKQSDKDPGVQATADSYLKDLK